MSKRKLISFLKDLDRSELEEQVMDLYQRFKEVKTFYDFSFNPNEEKCCQEAKLKISKEYFPETRRRAKKRRSVAQKIFQDLIRLEFNPELLADLMLFNLEIAQSYTEENPIKQAAFYPSMLKSYRHAIVYISENGYQNEFGKRLLNIKDIAHQQNWPNAKGFDLAIGELLNP